MNAIPLGLSTLPSGAFTTPLAVDGFQLTPYLNGSSTPSLWTANGTTSLIRSMNIGAAGADTALTMVGGGTYTLVSVDVAALLGDRGSWGIGISADTGAATIYGAHCTGVPLSTSFVTETLDWQGVSSVDLDPVDASSEFAISAITVSCTPAPKPASFAVLAVGFAGLGLMRRRTV